MLPSLMAVQSSGSFTGLTRELCVALLTVSLASSLARQKGVMCTWCSIDTMILASRAEHDQLELASRLADATKHHLIAASQPGKPTNHRLFPHSIVAGQEASPTEFHRGFQRRRDDLKTTHGDADVTMIQQEAKVVNDGVESIRVLNTDAQLWGR